MFIINTVSFPKVGIGIGGEYPAGSVGAAESTGELKSGSRNLWFIMFTNTMIDWVRNASLSPNPSPQLDPLMLTDTGIRNWRFVHTPNLASAVTVKI